MSDSAPRNPTLQPSRGSGIQKEPKAGAAPPAAAFERPLENGVDVPSLILDMVAYQTANCAGHRFTREVHPDELRMIGNLLSTVRWLYISNEETAKSVWDDNIKTNAVLLEYVLRLTQNVSFYLHGWNVLDTAIELMSTVLAKPPTPIYDQALAARLSDIDSVRRLLQQNPWLLALQLAALSDGTAALGRVADPRQAEVLAMQRPTESEKPA